MKKGLLLINLGTPDSCTLSDVRAYLREFLADKRVITLPSILRYTLLYGAILPFRTQKTRAAYQAIWTDAGSPLRQHTEELRFKLQSRLGENYVVSAGMRYGNPNLKSALNQLSRCDSIHVLPLYPQYSSAATGSSIEAVLKEIADNIVFPSIRITHEFYQDPRFIHTLANHIEPYIQQHDYVLFSYHGLPVRHLQLEGCTSLCTSDCPQNNLALSRCYRAKCQETSRLLANQLCLPTNTFSSTFQSRLGRTPWISPYLDETIKALASQGVKRLLIVCPSFVADCLETLEEIAIRTNEQWLELGGEQLTVAPCLNADDAWADAIADMIQW